MKKIISVLLATILLASMVIPANASSYNDFLDIDEAEYDMDAYYADLWNNYNHNMHGLLWDYICGENYYVYTQAVKEVGNDASKKNISQVFNAETFIIGLCSGLIGVGITLLTLIPANAIIHAVTGSTSVNAALPVSSAVLLIVLSVILTLIGGLIPSKKAAKKDPVTALRTE